MLHERKARLAEGHATMSSAEGEAPSVRGRAPRVGAELRAARQRYGWELDAVAASLRIRASYLEAIEAGRIAGWAFQPEQPERPVWLEVLEDDGVVARVEARRYRADLEEDDAGVGGVARPAEGLVEVSGSVRVGDTEGDE